MKTSFMLSQEDFAHAINSHVGKQFRGSLVTITGTRFEAEGVIIDAELTPKAKVIRGPRKVKAVDADGVTIAKVKRA